MTHSTKVEKKIEELKEKLHEIGEDRVPLDDVKHYHDHRRQCEVLNCTVRIDGEKYGFEQAITLEAIEDGETDGLLKEMSDRNMRKLEESVSIKYTHSIHTDGDAVNAIISPATGHVRCLTCDERIFEFDAAEFNRSKPEQRAKAKRYLIGEMFDHSAGMHFL